ncbi:MAG: hypothetical protein E7555_06255 [Ruminococcaceae bacterium]|nr:hypothetical protein [Oscillospiraceae bacterium]
MENLKETKKFKSMIVLTFLFFLLRTLLLSNRNYLGIEDMYKLSFNMSYENIALIVLLVLFAVLASLVITKLNKKFGSLVSVISVLLIAEPLFFAKQVDCIVLFIANLGLAFILISLKKKNAILNEINLIVFLLASCILAQNAIYVFVIPALMIYFIGGIENTFKSTKKIVMLVLSVISIAVGMSIGNMLTEKYSAFESFVKKYTFFEHIYYKHIDYENILIFVFLVPTALFGIYFFKGIFKSKDKNDSYAPYLTCAAVVIGYAFSIVGFARGGTDNLYTANYIVPIAVFSMINSGNEDAKKSLSKVNSIIEKHLLVFISVVVLFFYLAARIFYEDVDNIAGFILNI